MELLPGFFLNSFGVGLELINLARELGVVLLQKFNSLLQLLVLASFGAIHDHAVAAEHHMRKEPYRKY